MLLIHDIIIECNALKYFLFIVGYHLYIAIFYVRNQSVFCSFLTKFCYLLTSIEQSVFDTSTLLAPQS